MGSMPENSRKTDSSQVPNKPEGEESKKSIRDLGKYAGLGFQMMAIIGVCAFIGFKVDEYYHHETQWVTALSGVFGVCLSIYQIIRQSKS